MKINEITSTTPSRFTLKVEKLDPAKAVLYRNKIRLKGVKPLETDLELEFYSKEDLEDAHRELDLEGLLA
jgi:hypothetical protein